MRNWSERSAEVKYLMNPAFCGRLLYVALREYEGKTGLPLPFPLLYLILPLVLHKKTRVQINSHSKLLNWAQMNQSLFIDFAVRARGLVEITNEALEFLVGSRLVRFTDEGDFRLNQEQKKLSETGFLDEEIRDCISKSKHVARWFVDAGSAENVYLCFGVRP